MPIPIIYALIACALFGAGYGTAWKHDQSQIIALQTDIDLSNERSAATLLEISKKVIAGESAQTITNAQLEDANDKNDQMVSDSSDTLNAVRLQWSRDKASRDCTVSKADNTRVDKKDDGTRFYLDTAAIESATSRLIQAANPDQIDQNKHKILAWLRSLPPELLK